MRISTDGFIDIRTHTKVRTPGLHEVKLDPMPEAEAVAFLLSHSFPGHRRIVRPLSPRERIALKRASWADSVNERMSIVDRVWRDITTTGPTSLRSGGTGTHPDRQSGGRMGLSHIPGRG